MTSSETRPEHRKQAGCGGLVAGILGALLAFVVLMLAGVANPLFAAVGAGVAVGVLFALRLGAKLKR